jgi:hypothetical protein
MAKYCNSTVLDAGLKVILDNASKISVCSAVPSNVADADSTANYQLAVTTLSTGSFTLQAGLVSGRRLTVAAQSSIAINKTGVASNIALYSTVTNQLYYVTNCTTQSLASTANKVTIPSWNIELRDAT